MNATRNTIRTICATACAAGFALGLQAGEPKLGYDDTPLIPGQTWKVHDGTRPQPPVVRAPAPAAADVPAQAPSDAIVLFDGTNTEAWKNPKTGAAPAWTIEDGVLVAKGGNIETKQAFRDIQLHIEWAVPAQRNTDWSNRGNSGVFLFGKYEVQIYDSFGDGIYADGNAGALYGQYPPLVNATKAPGAWQSYDILFTAPRFKDGTLETPAYLTVLHNGVLIHNHVAVLGSTGHKILPKYEPTTEPGPIRLQDHGDPVRFRNIWVRELKPQGGTEAVPAQR